MNLKCGVFHVHTYVTCAEQERKGSVYHVIYEILFNLVICPGIYI